MTDGQVVTLNDGAQAKVKQIQVSSWQVVPVVIELPKSSSASAAASNR